MGPHVGVVVVGAPDGARYRRVGPLEGAELGPRDGLRDGPVEGPRDGDWDGRIEVGVSVVGTPLGDREGDEVGDRDGECVRGYATQMCDATSVHAWSVAVDHDVRVMRP